MRCICIWVEHLKVPLVPEKRRRRKIWPKPSPNNASSSIAQTDSTTSPWASSSRVLRRAEPGLASTNSIESTWRLVSVVVVVVGLVVVVVVVVVNSCTVEC